MGEVREGSRTPFGLSLSIMLEEHVKGGDPATALGCCPPPGGGLGDKKRNTEVLSREGLGSGVAGRQTAGGAGSHLQVPAWYLRVLTLCLWAGNVRTHSPESASQHLTVLSALPEYTCWSTS